MSHRVLAISASPSATSKTALAVDYALDALPDSLRGPHVALRNLDPAALARCDMRAPDLARLLDDIAGADGIILATPIYKASFSGLLKLVLDIMPQFGLAGKTVLPLATGGSLAHVLALDYGLRPVLQSMGARHIVQGQFLSERDFDTHDGTPHIRRDARVGLDAAIAHFAVSLQHSLTGKQWGHPRPD